MSSLDSGADAGAVCIRKACRPGPSSRAASVDAGAFGSGGEALGDEEAGHKEGSPGDEQRPGPPAAPASGRAAVTSRVPPASGGSEPASTESDAAAPEGGPTAEASADGPPASASAVEPTASVNPPERGSVERESQRQALYADPVVRQIRDQLEGRLLEVRNKSASRPASGGGQRSEEPKK